MRTEASASRTIASSEHIAILTCGRSHGVVKEPCTGLIKTNCHAAQRDTTTAVDCKIPERTDVPVDPFAKVQLSGKASNTPLEVVAAAIPSMAVDYEMR